MTDQSDLGNMILDATQRAGVTTVRIEHEAGARARAETESELVGAPGGLVITVDTGQRRDAVARDLESALMHATQLSPSA